MSLHTHEVCKDFGRQFGGIQTAPSGSFTEFIVRAAPTRRVTRSLNSAPEAIKFVRTRSRAVFDHRYSRGLPSLMTVERFAAIVHCSLNAKQLLPG